MTTATRLHSNRQNSLSSTGPRTTGGKLRSSQNSLSTGLYARLAVVPTLGESQEECLEFTHQVADDLNAAGAVELALADQIAGLLWRLRRVRIATTLAYQPPASVLPPDPASITGEREDPAFPPPPGAPLARRLGFTRALLRGHRCAVARKQSVAGIMEGEGNAAEPIHLLLALEVGWAMQESLALSPTPTPFSEALSHLGIDPTAPAWTQGLLRQALAAQAEVIGWDATKLRMGTLEILATQMERGVAQIERLESEEAELVSHLLAERASVSVSAAMEEEGLLVRAGRIESQLNRELERMLGMLERLQTNRQRVIQVGFVSPRVSVRS